MLSNGKEVEVFVGGHKVVFHNPVYEFHAAEEFEDFRIIIRPNLDAEGKAVTISDVIDDEINPPKQ